MQPQKFTYTELMQTKVINPAFEPTVEQYAKAYLFAEDYWKGKRNYIVTSKPYLWALALQRIESRDLSNEEIQKVHNTAKKLRQRKQQR
jgi:hypothetical protein